MPGRHVPASGVTSRVDIASFIGLFSVLGCILGGVVLEGGRVADIAQSTAALIVFGGTIGAVLVTTPLEVFLAAARRSSEIFFIRSHSVEAILKSILASSERARKSGLSCLEFDASQTNDSFLRKGLDLAADGNDLRQIREIMLIELDREEERSEAEVKVWESAAGYSPTVGIMGAVLGLIQVMKHLDNVDEVGRGIAVAFVATVYGVAAANLLFLPVAGKLKARSRGLEQMHEMMLEGVLAIAEGMNPTLIRLKLGAFLKPIAPATGRVSAPARTMPQTTDRIPAAIG